MIPESFSQLTTDLEAELYRLHYTQAATNYYRRMRGHVGGNVS
ncbi:hypothetical protein [Acidithrix ferrooxidans]|nr:hypothetical protein [Acidithrix ferrooxidans]